MTQDQYEKGPRFGIPTVLCAPLRLQRIGGKPVPNYDYQACHRERQAYRALQQERDSVLGLLDKLVFVLQTTNYLQFKLSKRAMPVMMESLIGKLCGYECCKLELEEERRTLSTRKKDVELFYYSLALPQLQPLISMTLEAALLPARLPAGDMPGFFLRLVLPKSATRYNEHLGFRCGNSPEAEPDYHADELRCSLYFTYAKLKAHCDSQRTYSDFISMLDSPQRLFKFIQAQNFADLGCSYIAVINTSKLLRMRVLFDRTTTLASHASMARPEFAHTNFWVAYRWIPAECIECFVTLKGFDKMCYKNEGAAGHQQAEWLKYKERVSVEDISLASRYCYKKPPPSDER